MLSLRDIYTRWCVRKAQRTIRDSSHPKPWTAYTVTISRNTHQHPRQVLSTGNQTETELVPVTPHTHPTNLICTATLSLTLTGLTIILQPDILFALIHTVLHCKGICVLGLPPYIACDCHMHLVSKAVVLSILSYLSDFPTFPLKQRVVQFDNEKYYLLNLYLINLYTYHNPKLTLTPYSNSDTLNIVVQREKRMQYLCAHAQ